MIVAAAKLGSFIRNRIEPMLIPHLSLLDEAARLNENEDSRYQGILILALVLMKDKKTKGRMAKIFCRESSQHSAEDWMQYCG